MDPLSIPYCCLDCAWKGRFGQLIGADTVRCPRCKSANLNCADGKIHTTEVWHGAKPDLFN